MPARTKAQNEAWLVVVAQVCLLSLYVCVSFNVVWPVLQSLGFVFFLESFTAYMWAIYQGDFHSNEPSG